jgi:hypothetical protein
MEIEHLLRHLKKIESRAEYRAHLRAHLLTRARHPRRLTWRDVVIGAFQSGSAIALTVVLIVLMVGGFSIAKYVQKVAGLDPQGLRAEAHAIDMQLELTGLDYQDFGTAGTHALAGMGVHRAAPRPSKPAPAAGTGAATVTTTTDSGEASAPAMSVDEALELLSH